GHPQQQRLRKQVVRKRKFWLTEYVQAKLQMPPIVRRSDYSGPEQEIPNRKGLTEIGVGLCVLTRMVDTMEFGCDDNSSNNCAKSGGKSKVGMGEELDDKRNPSVRHNLGRREPDHQNGDPDHNTVENRLCGMVPKRRGGIDFRIGVVNQ